MNLIWFFYSGFYFQYKIFLEMKYNFNLFTRSFSDLNLEVPVSYVSSCIPKSINCHKIYLIIAIVWNSMKYILTKKLTSKLLCILAFIFYDICTKFYPLHESHQPELRFMVWSERRGKTILEPIPVCETWAKRKLLSYTIKWKWRNYLILILFINSCC